MSNAYSSNKLISNRLRILPTHCMCHVNFYLSNRVVAATAHRLLACLSAPLNTEEGGVQVNTTSTPPASDTCDAWPTYRGVRFQMVKHAESLGGGQMCGARCSTPFVPEFSTTNFLPDSRIHNEWWQKCCGKQMKKVSVVSRCVFYSVKKSVHLLPY